MKALEFFDHELRTRGAEPKMHDRATRFTSEKETLDHCAKMLEEMKAFIAEDRFDKFMRWVCWMQGALNTQGILTIDDFRQMNLALLHADD